MGLRIPESVERTAHRIVTFLLALLLGPPATSIGYAALGDLRATYTIDPIADPVQPVAVPPTESPSR